MREVWAFTFARWAFFSAGVEVEGLRDPECGYGNNVDRPKEEVKKEIIRVSKLSGCGRRPSWRSEQGMVYLSGQVLSHQEQDLHRTGRAGLVFRRVQTESDSPP